jgi:hypothetical protein
MRKTNPISGGSPQRHRDHRGGLGFLDKQDLDFILRVLRVSVVSNRAKRTQLCETNPILRLRISDCGLAADLRGATNRAKRTQFRVVPGGTRPGGRRRKGQMRKTNPISPVGRGPGGRNVQNEPNFRPARLRGTFDCAKQTQFPATPRGTRPQGRGTRRQMCKTNPISGYAGGTRPGGGGRGAIVRNDCAKRIFRHPGPYL